MAIPVPLPEPDAEAGPSSPPRGGYRLAHSLSAHTRGLTALRFSSDGRVLVSAGADGYLHLWDPSGEHRRSIRAHRTGINDISISPDSLYLATASDDTTSTIYALSPSLPSSSFSSFSAVPFLASSSASASSQPLRHLATHTAPVLAVAFSPKSNLLVTGSYDESAIVWDVKRGQVLRVLPAHSDAVWTVGWDAEGGMVMTGSADGLIRLWDAGTGQCLKTFDNDTNSPVSYATITPSSFFLLSSTLSSTLRIYNMHTSKVLKTLRAPEYVSQKHPCPAIIWGKQLVASGSENGKVVIWDVATRTVVQVLEGHSSPVVALSISPDGRTIASGSLEPEKMIHIWNA